MQQRSIPSVYCVGVEPADLSPELREVLEPYSHQSFGNVYRVLVRINRETPDLVIVGVDWLPAVAFEFFDILARTHRELPVLVVGAKRAQAKLDEAIVRGAMGVATPEIVADLLAGEDPDSTESDDSHTPPTSEGKKPDTFASPGNVFDAELDRRLRDQVGGLDDEPNARDAEATGQDDRQQRDDRQQKDNRQQFAPDAASDTGNFAPPEESAEDADATGMDVPEMDVTKIDATDARVEVTGDEQVAEREHITESTARVPWESYGNRPTRVPPSQTVTPPTDGADFPPETQAKSTPHVASPIAGDGKKAHRGSRASEPDETKPRNSFGRPSGALVDDDPPLLTAEEIAALMGGEPFHGSN